MARRPSVLLIMADQHQASALGSAGHAVVKTPNLDALSDSGIRFTNAYCNNPLCVPSRSILLTGKHSRSLGIYDNKHILEPNSPTLPRILGRAGYQTCLIGKMHFNGEQFQGFQQRPYGDMFGQGHQPDPRRSEELGVNGLGDNLLEHVGPSGIPLALTNTEICVAEAAKWMSVYAAEGQESPFFLCVSFEKPHFPLAPPGKYLERYRSELSTWEGPSDLQSEPVPFIREQLRVNDSGKYYGVRPDLHRAALAAYYGCVEWVDDAVGRLLAVVSYLGLGDSTAVIYTSDHGEMGTGHGLWQKTVFFEDSVKVPLIAAWPGEWAPGRTTGNLVSLVDILPTLCELCGVESPEGSEGKSLLPVLQGGILEAGGPVFAESVVLGSPEHAGCMMRIGRWKYCYYLDGTEELYDLDADPRECENLALTGGGGTGHGPGLLEEVREEVVRWWDPAKQLERYWRTPMAEREKHFYPASNQFLTDSGRIIDSMP